MKGLAFSDPMMIAWLAGRKTVMRELMKHQPGDIHPYLLRLNSKPRYLPGETVYIKEAWSVESGHLSESAYSLGYYIEYKVGGQKDLFAHSCPISKEELLRFYDSQRGVWRPSRFMPEWASRSHALIVSNRRERIMAITEDEAIKEGVEPFILNGIPDYEEGFVLLWEQIHGHESWDRNDWVFRYELEKIS